MTDNIGEQMTDEEMHEAQPKKDFVFQLVDQEPIKLNYRNVTVPNWIGRDGHWAEVYNALSAARNCEMAKSTEMIVKAMERAREVGREEGLREATAMNETVRSVAEREYEKAVRRQSAMPRQVREQLSPKAREFPNKGDQG
jgi:hypothetical protein